MLGYPESLEYVELEDWIISRKPIGSSEITRLTSQDSWLGDIIQTLVKASVSTFGALIIAMSTRLSFQV